ncbi:ubiquinone-binding protein [Mergibacter septicus]|uniref:Ubiquinone-binding protein n=1 Tax=Mergibacter septicus TaxID=221402 RepID=A0A8E3MH91_9PAST|nr:type II toxin-antitoxin system RatA family toxin [Mergibacter septicus]AWX16238.1 ubiquinone-binding protein [Mergibacter septicus]QDJ15490.1 ubiquinone-binding protein [Mergibacter septicus]UTU48640.1 type II toxin-antitoxin system RatA family toxin [Mergibacter septicus]WMR95730.1 type II toxin-antitoxin system RatA family toxin [Mergibacter septicus]
MPIINQTALVAYSAEQMYQLVNDYQRYPEFLPGCVASRTIDQGEYSLTAELTISKAGISQSFSTHNTIQPNREIIMKLLEGPFRYLQGRWLFEPFDEQSCQISLYLEFEFSNPLMSMLFSPIFQQLTSQMIEAFKLRAKEVYAL